MSITFSIRGRAYDVEDYDSYVNLGNVNAAAILRLLGYCTEDEQQYGSCPAPLFRAKLERLTRELTANPEKDAETGDEIADRWIQFGRRGGYFKDTAARLLKLVENAAFSDVVTWG